MAGNPALWSDVQRDLSLAKNHCAGAASLSKRLRSGKPAFDEQCRSAMEESAGLKLQYCYSAIENAIDTLVMAVDGSRPIGEGFHTRLIARAASSVPKLRPAMISEATATDLHALKDFRHVVRHLYDRSFDYGKAEPNIEVAKRTVVQIGKELAAFAKTMKIIGDEPSGRD